MKGFENGRLQTAARAIGVMQAAYEAAHHYAAERRVFGRPIGDYQLTQVKLGRMATIIQATRQFAYQVARLMANGGGAIQAPMLKAYACQAAEWVTREAMQIHGGMGYAEEFPVSRYFVDARVLSIFEGADEILALKVISRRLIEKAAPHRRPTVCRAIAALPSTAGSPRRPRPSRWKAHPPAPFGAYARGPGIEKMHVTGGHPSVSVQVPATTPWNQRFAPRASVCPGARATLAADETRAHRPPLSARSLSVRRGLAGSLPAARRQRRHGHRPLARTRAALQHQRLPARRHDPETGSHRPHHPDRCQTRPLPAPRHPHRLPRKPLNMPTRVPVPMPLSRTFLSKSA
jgi:hypothetical protein